MDERMSLEHVREWHRKEARAKDTCGELMFPGPNESPFYCLPTKASKEHDAMADAIDAHLATPAQTVDVGRKEAAIELAVKYGGIDGAHHKDWVIDQIVRVLAGDDYAVIVAEAKAGDDGPDTYGWNEGIAP